MSASGIPVSSRTRIYRRICDQLRTDPVIGDKVEWIFWDGSRKDVTVEAARTPVATLYPRTGALRWTSEDGWKGPLEINVEFAVPHASPDVTVCMDLWEAMERALYPKNKRDKQLTFQKQLVELGAEIGLIDFPQPATISARPNKDGGFSGVFDCFGIMTIDVLTAFNP